MKFLFTQLLIGFLFLYSYANAYAEENTSCLLNIQNYECGINRLTLFHDCQFDYEIKSSTGAVEYKKYSHYKHFHIPLDIVIVDLLRIPGILFSLGESEMKAQEWSIKMLEDMQKQSRQFILALEKSYPKCAEFQSSIELSTKN